MQNYNSLQAGEVGHMLDDFGVNLLVSNVQNTVKFLHSVFDFMNLRSSEDYALLKYRNHYYQLHSDQTYSNHPLLSVLPEAGIRGAGVELRLFEVDPDKAEKEAKDEGYTVLQTTSDKPHGLRECFILDPDGYCYVPSIKI